MRIVRPRFQFRVKLTAEEPRMILKLHHFYQFSIRGLAARDESLFGQKVTVIIGDLIAVPMSYNFV